MLIRSVLVKKSTVTPEGYGVYSTTFLPKGTIIWFPCEECEIYTPVQMEEMEKQNLFELDEYGYYLNDGNNILPCGQAHLLNHSCEANVLDFGLDFGIAVKDILPNDEITIDYGTFYADLKYNDWTVQCSCKKKSCRKIISPSDFSNQKTQKHWEKNVLSALNELKKVNQPLHSLLEHNSEKYRKLLETENYSFSDLNQDIRSLENTINDTLIYR
jgi:uncharacterized protein